ncbi:hypothetical protein B296_00025820 [Ensete ventricosum]|uniref:Uncharacterized protein n=1 Tax=Ensete ventricosum TaxID=4639 RepID=A0A427A1I5_ENSVE|nr:hypothetical protein B296_00025820 [Ensete ventricosum]
MLHSYYRNQAKLQRNLMYLAAIADSQQVPTLAQPMTPQSLLAARSSMLYAQSPMSTLQQQQQTALHGQLGVGSGGNSGFNVLHGEASIGGNGMLAAGVFSDFGRSNLVKQEAGNASSAEGRGGNPGRQSGDGAEPLYSKGSEEETNQ